MTKARRVGNILTGLLIIFLGTQMAVEPTRVYKLIILVLGLTLLLSGIRSLIYYFTMAKHMVGGRSVLYRAVIVIDIGLFSLSLTNIPFVFVILYLAAVHGFSGFVDIMMAREARMLQAGSWKLNFIHGLINVIMAILCLVFLGTPAVAVEIYAFGLMYSGLMRIIQAFRKTAVVYIQ